MSYRFQRAAGPSQAARLLRGVLVALFAISLISFAAYRIDRRALRTVAHELTDHVTEPSQRVLALNHWIHAHLPTKPNPDSFIWSRLRATPLQVLERGGDCADKSRLLSAMLRELGIPATMAMLFDKRTGLASHTVVEARLADDHYMVVDPSFELHFPDGESGQFLGIVELRRDPSALHRRLSDLQAAHARPALYHVYPVGYATYEGATTINWNKNAVTRTAHDVLIRWVGEELYRWSRPVALEEPKLFVSLATLVLAVSLYGCGQFVTRLGFRLRGGRRAAHTATGSQMISGALKTGPSVQHSR